MKILLSTRNPSKAEQINAIFQDTGLAVVSLADAGIEGEGVEDSDTLEGNALRKAYFAHGQAADLWSMADDTGLFIDALAGRPGIKAARWAGEDATTDEITAYTLMSLKGAANRGATFKTVVAVVSPAGYWSLFRGQVRGIILEAPRVRPQPKMPYSPIFMPEGETLVWAEMTVEHENRVSHRGMAFRQARDFLKKQIK